ncbi:hypothetical protein [Nocardia sp. NPDC019395]|uniref:ABC transporter substrate-binding protein n=1 Tax=Nocardia sp. NPDC019395 TaxID=3154686 RepID=UPI0033F4F29E
MSTLIQPPPPGYRKWWWIPAAIVVIVLAVGAAIWVPPLFRDCRGDGIDQSGQGNECVGVTDGSSSFNSGIDEIEKIQQSILAENRAVEAGDAPYVSVVLLTPMTVGDNGEGIGTISGIRHRLEGAHLAQLAANKHDYWGGNPKVRLLLANPGSDFGEWKTAVEKIEEKRKDDKIVAVTGISFSVEEAFAAIDRLHELGMPVIGSTLTTGDDRPKEGGFLQISPPATEHGQATAEFLNKSEDRILIVRDDNPRDRYGSSLAEGFEAAIEDRERFLPTEHYDSEYEDLPNTFGLLVDGICQNPPDTIYFAGRADDALPFLTQLTQRDSVCRETPIRVFTGDDMPYWPLTEDLIQGAQDSKVSVHYTGLVHQDVWQQHPDWFHRESLAMFTDDCAPEEVCYRNFSSDPPNDFAAAMEYDAVVTAVKAIRLGNTATDTDVTSEMVWQKFNRLHGVYGFCGASGKLDFDPAANGLPVHKPILVLKAPNAELEYVKGGEDSRC